MRALAGVCLGAVLAAQGPQTFVVDVANGPGTHFTQINAAAAAVPDGSILLVRPGAYGGVSVQAKGLTILCDPGVTAGSQGSFLSIQGTQPGQVVVVRGLGQASASPLFVFNAMGPVVLDGAGASIVNTGSAFPLWITSSPQVVLQRWSISSATGFLVAGSRVVLEECDVVGGNGFVSSELGWVPPTPGLTADNSMLQLVHCSVRGGNGGTYVFVRPGAAAVQLSTGSSLRAVGLATHALVGGSSPAATQSALLGGGTARVEPQIPMTGNPVAGPGIVLTRPVMSSLLSQDTAPGGNLVARRYGAPGSVFVVALGLPGPAVTLPGVADPLWFDAAHFCIEAVAVGPASGPFVIQRPVPNQPGLVGVNLVWQAADLHATGAIELGNPSPGAIR